MREQEILDEIQSHRGGMIARIRQVRGARSQNAWAGELGVCQGNIHRYENGTAPHCDFLIRLALKEKVNLHWLLLGKGRAKSR